MYSAIKEMKRKAETHLIDQLAKEGERLMSYAVIEKETLNRTDAQLEAYGYAVYHNGVRKRVGYAVDNPRNEVHKGWKKMGIEPNTGRGYLDDFFASYTPNPKGFDLIVVNAVFYSQILEDGAQSVIGKKYRIVSQIRDDFENLENKLKSEGMTTNVKVISPVGHFG